MTQTEPGNVAGGERTLADVMRMFDSEETAEAWLYFMRWPNGVICPLCGSESISRQAAEGRSPIAAEHVAGISASRPGRSCTTPIPRFPSGQSRCISTAWTSKVWVRSNFTAISASPEGRLAPGPPHMRDVRS